ncbi:hypothetical protein ACFWY5_39475 [Nonomuraea sp. NPDC059007]|uniref:hypothetical protein n=1 Tax=Nonomuraea sp. NPDC059007 TaxID=3346692 RepID=UPI00368702FC
MSRIPSFARVALAGYLLAAGCATQPEPGAADPRAAVDAYVAGLNAADHRAVARLAPPLNDPAEDIRRRLAAYGGKAIKLTSVELSSDITPKAVRAELAGAGTGGRYSETLTLERQDGRWFIALGSNPDVPADRRTASTTRPG